MLHKLTAEAAGAPEVMSNSLALNDLASVKAGHIQNYISRYLLISSRCLSRYR